MKLVPVVVLLKEGGMHGFPSVSVMYCCPLAKSFVSSPVVCLSPLDLSKLSYSGPNIKKTHQELDSKHL